MNTYFFDPKKFGSLYNCTNFPFDIVPLEQRRKPLLGSVYLLLGILLEVKIRAQMNSNIAVFSCSTCPAWWPFGVIWTRPVTR